MSNAERGSVTRSQLRYWGILAALFLAGVLAAAFGDHIPWMWVRPIARELGAALVTAAILGAVVEPYFRAEFARDAFWASFRYVLPPEFKDQVARVLRFDFMADKHIWVVKIEALNADTVRVTSSFERILRNITSASKQMQGYYQVYDWGHPEGNAEVLECSIEHGGELLSKFETKNDKPHSVEARTKSVIVRPTERATIRAKAIVYKRAIDSFYEIFLSPAVNPQIEVTAPDELEFDVEFGSLDPVEQEHYVHIGTRFEAFILPAIL